MEGANVSTAGCGGAALVVMMAAEFGCGQRREIEMPKYDEEQEDAVRGLIAEIEDACRGKEAIFRGENKQYPYPVSSKIYRIHQEHFSFLNENFDTIDIEKNMIEHARSRYFRPDSTAQEILTDLQHFGGLTNLIDFSRNMFVALFFACNGETDKDGYVFVLPVQSQTEDIHDKDTSKSFTFLEPARTEISRVRVEGQHSVFVYTRYGHVSTGEKYLRKISIPKHLKRPCLKYLAQFCNIRTETVYNDLFGYIQNQHLSQRAIAFLHSGRVKIDMGEEKSKNGIDHYKEAIKDFEQSIKDFDKAIELKPDLAEAFSLLGYAQSKIAKLMSSLGDEKNAIKKYKDAIENFDEAIRFKPDFLGAFFHRGLAKFDRDKAGAKADLEKACELARQQNNTEALTQAQNLLNKLNEEE
ncbi:MAG: FRG domain-containing protein [Cellvibrionales bacterium]|nr:FRG domain-containing protein [Cellvibrionales bacterium]